MWLQAVIGTDPDVAYFRSRYCLPTYEQKALVADLTRVCRFRATSDIPATLDPDERAALAAYLEERSQVRRPTASAGRSTAGTWTSAPSPQPHHRSDRCADAKGLHPGADLDGARRQSARIVSGRRSEHWRDP
jgi:hypothetical protein